MNNYTKLEYLAAWKKRPLVDKMIDNGISGYYLDKWINENGLTISTPTVYKYIDKRLEATKKGITIEELLSAERRKRLRTRRPKVVKEIESGKDPKPKKKPFNNPTDQERQQNRFSINHITNDMEVLDAILDKEYNQIKNEKTVSPDQTKMILDTLNTKYKLTEGKHRGLTVYGMEKIRLEQKALENAVVDILSHYIPKEKHNEVMIKIQNEMSKVINKIEEQNKRHEAD